MTQLNMKLRRGAFEGKADEFKSVLKIGRTQLQDAVPMTLGQEFLAFAIMIKEDEQRLREATADEAGTAGDEGNLVLEQHVSCLHGLISAGNGFSKPVMLMTRDKRSA